MAIIGAYRLTHPETGNFYIGYSSNVKRRVECHFRELRAKRHPNKLLQVVWDLYENLQLETYECKTVEEAYRLEQQTIKDNLFNPLMTNIGIGNDNYTLHPNKEDVIKNRTASIMKTHLSFSKEELVKKYGKFGAKNGMFGRTHTDEVKEACRVRSTGNKYALGAVRSPEVRAKLSAHASARVGGLNPFFGRTHSIETKERIRKVHLGRQSSCAQRVSILGQEFRSMTEAAKVLKIPLPTIAHRVRSKNPKFNNYYLM